MNPGATVFVAYPAGSAVAAMQLGGMSVLERILRDAARAGASRAVVSAEADRLPALPTLALAVEIVPPATPAPADATALPGDIIAGVAIADEPSRRRAAHALLQSCRRPYDGVGDRYVIRSISLRFTALFCRLGATPNQVTLANIAVGIAACGFAVVGTATSFAIAGALMFLQVVLDSSDGELARIRHLSSKVGMWMDNVSDDAIDNSFVAALGIGLGGPWLVVGVAAGAARCFHAYTIYSSVARAGRPGDVMSFRWWFDREGEELADRFETSLSPMAVLRSLGRRDLYVLVWAATCMLGLPQAALCVGAVLCAGHFGMAAVHTLKTTGRR